MDSRHDSAAPDRNMSSADAYFIEKVMRPYLVIIRAATILAVISAMRSFQGPSWFSVFILDVLSRTNMTDFVFRSSSTYQRKDTAAQRPCYARRAQTPMPMANLYILA